MTQPLIQLVYTSVASLFDPGSDLRSIQRAAADFNGANDITGLLLHRSGRFIQVLEGPPETVDALYDKIAADPRHHSPRVLVRQEATSRAMTGWSMGVLNLDDGGTEFERTFNEICRLGELCQSCKDEDRAAELIGLMATTFAGGNRRVA